MKPKLILIAIIISILTGMFSGCATTPYISQRGITTSPIKSALEMPFDMKVARAVDKESQDYHRSKRVGFNAINEINRLGAPLKFVDLSPDQKQLVQLIGLPEYERTFPNKSGRRVQEWIYRDQDYLVQFIYGRLVYLGPVDDLEKTLIDLGPPSDIYTFDFVGMRKEIFKYKSRFEVYAFQDDRLVVVQ
jgi:hypothetical protein